MPDPYEIRLFVRQQPDNTYQAVWEDTHRSQPFPFQLPLGKEDREDLRWYLEKYIDLIGYGDKVIAEGIERRMGEWGKALYDALFGSGEGRQVYNNLMQAADDGCPAYLTIADATPEVLIQPWELLRDKRAPLALQGVTIRRQLTGADRRRKPAPLALPLRVLLIVSRPSDVGFIDPRNSIPPLLDALEALPGQVEVEFCEPPTLPELERRLREARKARKPYHIVHFDGHGTYLPNSGVGALIFENDQGTKELVTGRQLGDLLAAQAVPLVVLEACRGADLSDRPVLGALAPALLESGVGSVIAFSHSVHIYAARLLVQCFYQELAGGQSVGQALSEARRTMLANPQRWLALGPNPPTVRLEDWFIPQLYQVGDDPVLFRKAKAKKAAADAPVEKPQKVFANFPPQPIYFFHGRARELLALERKFRKQAALVLAGMGGMGKTALAREAAHWWLRTGRFEGAVFQTFEQYATAEQAVLEFGKSLDGPEFSALPAEQQRRRAVELFHNRRVLWVWDNFESTLPQFSRSDGPASSPAPGNGSGDATAALPLEGGESPLSFGAQARERLVQLYRELVDAPKGGLPAGRLLVTCRPLATGLPGIAELELAGLAEPDALHLLTAVLERKDIRTDREGCQREDLTGLLRSLDYHPLSIELVAPHLKTFSPGEIRREFLSLLEQFKDERAREGRNQSLLASLEFSRRRLSPAAQAALPWLGWFEGGVFERFFLMFAQMEEAQWQPLRAELEATALLRVEEAGFNTPYLRFHPILAAAARRSAPGQPGSGTEADAEVAARFVDVYDRVSGTIYKLLNGAQPGLGMTLAGLEEANLRRAAELGFNAGLRREGWGIADMLRLFLNCAGRLAERDRLVTWLHAQTERLGTRLDVPACDAIRERAWSMLHQGQTQAALQTLRELIARLESEGLEEGTEALPFELGFSYRHLGMLLIEAGRPDLALPYCQWAIASFEGLEGQVARSNLSAALGDLSISFRRLGRYSEALDSAERGLAIDREQGWARNITVGLDQIASILRDQQRYAEAEQRYREALAQAEAAGDLGLQGTILQHQGVLQDVLEHYEQATGLYHRALERFQASDDQASEMRTCDLLGTTEKNRGQYDAAEAWYRRSQELAQASGNRDQEGVTAQNLGILYYIHSREAQVPAEKTDWLEQAVASVRESLEIAQEMRDQIGVALSFSMLGVLFLDLNDLDQSETNLLKGLHIRESLGLPDVYRDYANLALVARAKGDKRAAAEWQAKYDAKLAEVERLRRGEGTAAAQQSQAQQEQQLFEFFLSLAQACYQARQAKAPLDPEAAEALAGLAKAPAPFCDAAAFLQAFAAGQDPRPPVPAGLPKRVQEIFEELAGSG